MFPGELGPTILPFRTIGTCSQAKSGFSIDNETAAWVAKIGDELADKLACVGLVPSRKKAGGMKLAEFIEEYIAEH